VHRKVTTILKLYISTESSVLYARIDDQLQLEKFYRSILMDLSMDYHTM
jgi:hypothetical protein